MSELTQNRGQGILMVLRITAEAAAAFFLTAGILNYGAMSSAIGRWLAQTQIAVAAGSLGLGVLMLWIAVTLVFGRIYCSTVCPLGALMDLGARARSRRKVYRLSRPRNALRIISFALCAGLFLLRAPFASGWLEPYGLYATMVSELTSPRVAWATFFAALALAAVLTLAYRRGRLICNTVCPVGAMLGLLSRRSAMHIDIDTDRCTQCRRCADVCKAECIDLESHTVDSSRCIVCFNCLPECPNEAISYTLSRHTLSDPMFQKLKPLNQCDNTSTSCKTSSTTASSKPTAPEREP